jgi:hypothetical protein
VPYARRGITRFAGSEAIENGETAAKPKALPRSREVRRRVRVDRGSSVVMAATSKDSMGSANCLRPDCHVTAFSRIAGRVHVCTSSSRPPSSSLMGTPARRRNLGWSGAACDSRKVPDRSSLAPSVMTRRTLIDRMHHRRWSGLAVGSGSRDRNAISGVAAMASSVAVEIGVKHAADFGVQRSPVVIH